MSAGWRLRYVRAVVGCGGWSVVTARRKSSLCLVCWSSRSLGNGTRRHRLVAPPTHGRPRQKQRAACKPAHPPFRPAALAVLHSPCASLVVHPAAARTPARPPALTAKSPRQEFADESQTRRTRLAFSAPHTPSLWSPLRATSQSTYPRYERYTDRPPSRGAVSAPEPVLSRATNMRRQSQGNHSLSRRYQCA